MTVYIDTSVLLRIVLREPGALDDVRSYDALVSSELIAVESARTIDRLRLQGSLTADEAAARLRTVTEWLEAIDLVLLRSPVLSRASEPMPMPLGSLDAVHLATALILARPGWTTFGDGHARPRAGISGAVVRIRRSRRLNRRAERHAP